VARELALVQQLEQGCLDLDVQERFELARVEARFGPFEEGFDGGDQGAALRKPHRAEGPQAEVVEARDVGEGVVASAMGVAGEVVGLGELAKDGGVGCGAERALELVDGGDLVLSQPCDEVFGMEALATHNDREEPRKVYL